MKKIILCLCILCFTLVTTSANTREKVTLAKCVDGDTTHFNVEGKNIKVRYLAVNAPEFTKEKEPYGKEASDFVCDILTNASTIELEYDDGSTKEDKYGRTLAWVFADGKLVQKELVGKGLAEVKYLYGDYVYSDELKEIEKESKKKKLNMWSDTKENDSTWNSVLGSFGGIVLVVVGALFVKGKRNKTRVIKQGIRRIKNGKH